MLKIFISSDLISIAIRSHQDVVARCGHLVISGASGGGMACVGGWAPRPPPLRARLLPHCQTWPRHLSLGPTIKAMITRMDPQLGSLF